MRWGGSGGRDRDSENGLRTRTAGSSAQGGSGTRANVALLGGSIALTLIVAEVVARILLPAPIPWLYPQLRYRADPTLVFALEPGQFAFTADKPVSVNPRGLRGKLASYERSPGRTRLLFLGDSIVFGYGVTQGEGVTARVETRLSNENVPAEGINAGVPSYNAEQEVEFLEIEGVRYRPDWVIVGVCWNDINRKTGVLVSREGWLGEAGGNNQSWFLRMSESPMGYALRNGMKKSRLCFAIMQGLRSIEKLLYVDDHTQLMYDVLEGRETPRVADGWNRFGGALHRFAELSHQYHFQALVVTFPPSVALDKRFAQSTYPARVRELSEREGLHFLDLDASFRAGYRGHDSLFIPYDGDHPNATGHDVAAREIVKWITSKMNRARDVSKRHAMVRRPIG